MIERGNNRKETIDYGDKFSKQRKLIGIHRWSIYPLNGMIARFRKLFPDEEILEGEKI